MLSGPGGESSSIRFSPQRLKSDEFSAKVLADVVATTLRGGSTSTHFRWKGIRFGSHGLIYREQDGKLVRAYRCQLRDEVRRIIWNYIRFLCDATNGSEIQYRFNDRLVNEVMKELREIFPSKPLVPRAEPPQPPVLFHEGIPLLLGSLSGGSWIPVPGNPRTVYRSGVIGVACNHCKRSQRSRYPRIHYHGWDLESGYDVREHRGAHCEDDSPFSRTGYFIGLDPNGKHEMTPGVPAIRDTPKGWINWAMQWEERREARRAAQ